MPYKTLDDFEYLGMINDVPMTLIGRSTLPANNFAELSKWMADNKGKINLANAGLGAASHLCGLLFQQGMQIDMTTVPYKGTAPAMTDLLGGQVDLMCDQTTNTTGQIESGKVKAFAVTSAKRLTTPALYRNMPYKTLDDFEYLGMINDVPMTLIGRSTLVANNFAELREWMADNKGKINLANAGLGAASHLCGLLFQQAMAVDMTTVPYKGTAPAMTDLLGGQVDLMCDQTTNTSTQIEAGKVKAYAVTTMKPLTTPALRNLPTLDSVGLKGFNVVVWQGLYAPKGTPKPVLDQLNAALRQALKDLPTLDEAGMKGFNVTIWHGLCAPKGTPKAVLEQINTALRAALKDPEFIKRQEALGAVVVTDARLGPVEHKKFVEAEINKWGPAIKAAGQYAD